LPAVKKQNQRSDSNLNPNFAPCLTASEKH